eukprot:CAMPEP_0201653702 /NCGR_PEP_ID=MMETSP0493-20130528/45120_1 /ASSEMBLY_ACC=CAM_ASM_000838 /TAXON_ID=420259 /ORGANISM="Thalassiosira gravida, Strain GMp14c1" /LENGTH=603 /DNA_ID=CAMNT_0048130241 /DNA_START=139 /DNA_END=1951 /DNA_ORIENTATION=-
MIFRRRRSLSTLICHVLLRGSSAFAPPSNNLPYYKHRIGSESQSLKAIKENTNDVSSFAFLRRINYLLPTTRFYNGKDDTTNNNNTDDPNESSGDRLRRLRRIIIARRRRAITDSEDLARDRQDKYLEVIAIVPCLLAFFFWDEISLFLSQYIDAHGVLGSTPDGGAAFAVNILRPTITGVLVPVISIALATLVSAFAVNILRPTITGVLVPVISIALATLVSTTVNVLRERQVEIRALVNKEACDLRLLRRAIFGMFGTRQHAGRRARALTLLTAYVDQLNRECHPGAIESLEELELSGGIATNELDRLSAMMHGVDGAAVSRQGSVEVADDILSRLNAYRSDRVALLLTDFPDLHWIVLVALSVSIIVTFLLESNQLADQYLNSIQLRSLFALLVGVFSATATLCIDLDDPFTGSFSVVKASMQIGDLELCLQEDLREANAEAGEISGATRKFFRSFLGAPTEGGAASNCIKMEILTRGEEGVAGTGSKQDSITTVDASQEDDDASTVVEDSPPPTEQRGSRGLNLGSKSHSRYGFLSTIYFHLLTSPMGASVRVLGDVGAWATTIVVRRREHCSYGYNLVGGGGAKNQLEMETGIEFNKK